MRLVKLVDRFHEHHHRASKLDPRDAAAPSVSVSQLLKDNRADERHPRENLADREYRIVMKVLISGSGQDERCEQMLRGLHALRANHATRLHI